MVDKAADGVALMHVYVGEKTFQAHMDLAFVGEQVYAVFEWAPDDSPAVAVELDARHLRKVNGWGEVSHVYEFPIRDPRTTLN